MMPRVTGAPALHLSDAEVLERRPHGAGVITLTRKVCYCLGTDAGNRHMRKAGRTRWNNADAHVAAETTMRAMVFGGFAPPEIYEAQIGCAFPWQRHQDGTWLPSARR